MEDINQEILKRLQDLELKINNVFYGLDIIIKLLSEEEEEIKEEESDGKIVIRRRQEEQV